MACLNEVRPRRPEQFREVQSSEVADLVVSMKSGLEGRNNLTFGTPARWQYSRLNEVRPRRPEQCSHHRCGCTRRHVVSMKSGLEGRNNPP